MNFFDDGINKKNNSIERRTTHISSELEIVFWNIFYISENRINEFYK